MKHLFYTALFLWTAASLQAQEGAPVNKPVDGTTMLELIQSGGWAMIPLGVMSVITVMLVLVFMFQMRRGAVVSSHFMNTADVLLKKKDYLGLLAISARHPEAIARVTQRTLDFATKNPSAELGVIREIAETEGSAQSALMQSRIMYLADIAMLSPMVGLLGTVSGLIKSFGTLGSAGAENRNILLAAGVSEALVATATGLIIGIAGMAFYALFRGRVQVLISDLEKASTHVLGLIAVQFTREKGKPAAEKPVFGVSDDF